MLLSTCSDVAKYLNTNWNLQRLVYNYQGLENLLWLFSYRHKLIYGDQFVYLYYTPMTSLQDKKVGK